MHSITLNYWLVPPSDKAIAGLIWLMVLRDGSSERDRALLCRRFARSWRVYHGIWTNVFGLRDRRLGLAIDICHVSLVHIWSFRFPFWRGTRKGKLMLALAVIMFGSGIMITIALLSQRAERRRKKDKKIQSKKSSTP